MKLCPTGCALCHELVSTPHWCVVEYWAKHLRLCMKNAEYREALRALRDECLEEQSEDDQNKHHGTSEIISDLAAWGDWVWAQDRNFSTAQIDRAAVRRVTQILGYLNSGERSELYNLYVVRCTAVRLATRNGTPVPGYAAKGGRPKTLTQFTVAEQAYLQASKRADRFGSSY